MRRGAVTRRTVAGLLLGLAVLAAGCSAPATTGEAPNTGISGTTATSGMTGSGMTGSGMMAMPDMTADSVATGANPDGVVQAEPAAFAAAITGGRTVVNVHIPAEGSIAGTDLTIPYNELEQRSAELPQDRNTALAIYCMTGNMSAIAGGTLAELGYHNVLELHGGMAAWQAAGLPLIPAT